MDQQQWWPPKPKGAGGGTVRRWKAHISSAGHTRERAPEGEAAAAAGTEAGAAPWQWCTGQGCIAVAR